MNKEQSVNPPAVLQTGWASGRHWQPAGSAAAAARPAHWDPACTFMVLAAPVVVLAWFLPEAIKPGLGLLISAAAFVAATHAPVAGLFLTLLAIFHGASLLSVSGGDWGKLCAVLTLAGTLLYRHRGGQAGLRFPRATWFFVFILIATGLSALRNGQFAGADDYIPLVVGIFLFLLVYNCITGPQEMYEAAVGLTSLALTVVVIGVLSGDASNRIQASSLSELGNPNTMSLFLAFLLPLAIYLYMDARDKWVKPWAVICLTASLLALIWTGSRGGAVGLMAGLALLAIHVRPGLKQIVIGAALVGLALLATPADTRDSLFQHFTNEDEIARMSVSQREFIYEEGIRAFLENPWFGYGLGTSRYVIADRNPLDLPEQRSLHNVYLQVGLDLGLFGLVPFVCLVVSATLLPLRLVARRGQPGGEPFTALGWCISASLLIMAVGSLFQANFGTRLWYVALGLASAAIVVIQPATSAREAGSSPGTGAAAL